jgi:chemotaxis protein methyltransferase CheR
MPFSNNPTKKATVRYNCLVTTVEDLQKIERQVEMRLGYALRPRDRHAIARLMETENGAIDAELLAREENSESSVAWQKIIAALVNPETYFFRDVPQLTAIRDVLTKTCLTRNQHTRRLKIWSAGCSTGEEAYTLAILCQEAIATIGGAWNIEIIGTDVNAAALRVAEAGIYPEWSFRQLDAARRARWFSKVGETGKERVIPELKSMVRFVPLNLAQEHYPNISTDWDIIVCRNVFLYFDAPTVQAVANRFAKRLALGGFLVCGHTELHNVQLPELVSQSFAGTIAHQRPIVGASPPPNALFATKPVAVAPRPKVVVATPMLNALNASEMLLAARQLADKGDYVGAEKLCASLASAFPTLAPVYALQATLAEMQGRTDEAIGLLQKTLFLDPQNALACVELAQLYERSGKRDKAVRHWLAAKKMLESLPETQTLDPDETLTVADVRVHVEQSLGIYAIHSKEAVVV